MSKSHPASRQDPGPADAAGTESLQPADSPIRIERFADGVTIEVPPAGLWRGSSGLFFFGVLWIGITCLISVAMLGAFFDKKANANGALWMIPLILAVFWLVGIGLLLAAINMGRRRAAFAAMGGSLMVLQTGLFGARQREFPPDDLEAIRLGPSGMEVNHKPVLELQIIDGGGNKFGLLAGRSEAELQWLAAELTAALFKRPTP